MKTILIVLAALVATFIYPGVGVWWLAPIVVSMITLSISIKHTIAKYIGLLSLKPVLIWFLLWLIEDVDFIERLSVPYSAAIVPELILTTGIVYFFRGLFRSHKLAWIFLIADIVRWLVILITSWLIPPVFEVYYSPSFYVWVFFLLVYPSLYAIAGFLYVSIIVHDEAAADEKKVPSNIV